jgi:predicted ATP-grasp superfamily ATP-dependent carboligase
VKIPDVRVGREFYLDELATAARSIGAVAVLPGPEEAVVACAGEQERFGEQIALGAPDRAAVARVTDKQQLATLASESGFTAPTGVVVDRAALLNGSQVDYPVVVKPPFKVNMTPDGRLLTHRARRVNDFAHLRRLVEATPADRFLIQPYLGSRLEAVCGVALHGQVICLAHQRADRIFPPSTGISAYAHTVALDERLAQQVGRLISLTGWSGIFEVQLIRRGEQLYVIDFNPHLYGSLSLAVAAGLNLPAVWMALLLGLPLERQRYRPGTRYRNEEQDLGALLTALMRREWMRVALALLPRRNTAHAVLSIRDPLPALNSLRHVTALPAKIAAIYRRT